MNLKVSVPYRGATFLNRNLVNIFFWCRFPSPIGELHFSIMAKTFDSTRIQGFRPLSGSYISQSVRPYT